MTTRKNHENRPQQRQLVQRLDERDEYERVPRTARDYAQEIALQLIQGSTEPEAVTDAFEEAELV